MNFLKQLTSLFKKDFSKMSPTELGDSNHEKAILYLTNYLEKGTIEEKQESVLSIQKLNKTYPELCNATKIFLLKNLQENDYNLSKFILKTLEDMNLKKEDLDAIYNVYSDNFPSEIRTLMNALFRKYKYQNHSGFVYLIRKIGTDIYKIGKTKNVDRRMGDFGVQLPFQTEEIFRFFSVNHDKTEKLIHQHFKEKCVNGEWFQLNVQDIEDIKTCTFPSAIIESITGTKHIQETKSFKENIYLTKSLYSLEEAQFFNVPIYHDFNEKPTHYISKSACEQKKVPIGRKEKPVAFMKHHIEEGKYYALFSR